MSFTTIITHPTSSCTHTLNSVLSENSPTIHLPQTSTTHYKPSSVSFNIICYFEIPPLTLMVHLPYSLCVTYTSSHCHCSLNVGSLSHSDSLSSLSPLPLLCPGVAKYLLYSKIAIPVLSYSYLSPST